MDNYNNFQSLQIKVEFQYIGIKIDIYSNLNETTETIFKKFGEKMNKDINNIQFIYSGQNLNSNKFLFDIINSYDKERKIMTVIAYNYLLNFQLFLNKFHNSSSYLSFYL